MRREDWNQFEAMRAWTISGSRQRHRMNCRRIGRLTDLGGRVFDGEIGRLPLRNGLKRLTCSTRARIIEMWQLRALLCLFALFPAG